MKRPNKIKIIIALMVISCTLISCNNWVNEVDPITSALEGEVLDDEAQIDFILTGLMGEVSSGSGIEYSMWRNALFADELTTRVLGHSPDHVTWAQIWAFSMQFAEYEWEPINLPRYLADDLVARVNRIGTLTDSELKDRALWWGYLFGGVYRMLMADFFGLSQTEYKPGGVVTTVEQIDAGEYGDFINTSTLHAMALEKFTEALKYDPGDDAPGVEPGTADKIVHSFMARTYLFEGNLTQAKTHAEQGLQQGDEPFQILRDAQFNTRYWERSGRSPSHAHTASADWRFYHYVMADRDEGEIITGLTADEDPDGKTNSLRGYEGGAGLPGNYDTVDPRGGLANQNERLPLLEDWIMNLPGTDVGYTQDIYTARSSNFSLIDWREMEMILAEVDLDPSTGSGNGYSGSVADMLVHINNVRQWHSLTDLTVQDAMDYDNPLGGASTERITDVSLANPVNITGPKGLLIEERDKSTWLRGVRHMDQRRWGLWHLPQTSLFWIYQPVPDSEILQNPNLELSR